jgi:hypothetical protein
MTGVEQTTLLLTELSLGVAATSAVLAALTLFFVWTAERRFRHRFASVSWWMHPVQQTQIGDGSEAHTYDLINLGSESATNFNVDATSGTPEGSPQIAVVRSGDAYRFTVRTKNFNQDWILLRWNNADDRRYVRFQWFPLDRTGHLEEMRVDQWQKWRPRRWSSRTQPVGPGVGVIGTRVRAFEGPKTERGMEKARSLFEVTRNHPPQSYEDGQVRSLLAPPS